MLDMMLYIIYFGVTVLVLTYGLYCLLLPRLCARLSLWRLGYRIIMAILRKPAKPVAQWRVWWARCVGALCLAVSVVWMVNLHPQIRILPPPPQDPAAYHWRVENDDGSPEKARVLGLLDKTARKMGIGGRAVTCVGVCMGVLHGDKTYILGLGRRTPDSSAPPDADTVFEIGSITKTVTCAALASLVDEGEVHLDDPVASLLPGWTVPEYQGRRITLNDLATHRSGLPSMPDEPMPGYTMDTLLFRNLVDPYRNGTPEFVRGYLAQYKLPRAPGAEDEYSNLGMGLLGYALGQKMQLSYEDLIKRRVLEPLGMRDSGVSVNPEQAARFAQGYIGPIELDRLSLVFPMKRWTLTEILQGCGGINSTVHDMLKYVRANIEAPAGPLGKALARTQEPQFDTQGIENCKVGLGLMSVTIKGIDAPIYWHNGGTGGYNSFMAFSKKHKVGVVILAAGFCDEEMGTEVIKALINMDKGEAIDASSIEPIGADAAIITSDEKGAQAGALNAPAKDRTIPETSMEEFPTGDEQAVINRFAGKKQDGVSPAFPNALDHALAVLTEKAYPRPAPPQLIRETVTLMSREIQRQSRREIAATQQHAWAATLLNVCVEPGLMGKAMSFLQR